MKELLCIENGGQDKSKSYRLRDYNLTVYAGDIIYIQGLSGSGIKGLLEFLKGECSLLEGNLFIHEKLISDYSRLTVDKYRIYTISSAQDLIVDMTVTENLEVVRSHPFALKYYRRKNTEKMVEDFLNRENIEISANAYLWQMDTDILQRLSLLKAKMHGADIIVLDCTVGNYEGKTADEICQMIAKLRQEGMTFLILSERYSVFAEMADRIQLIYQGKDIMEWNQITPKVKSILNMEQNYDSEMKIKNTFNMKGLFDYEWRFENTIWKYLEIVKHDNKKLWDEEFNITIPEKGKSFNGIVAVIPRESSESLIEKLSIDDNIIITIPKRVSCNKMGIINNKLKRNIVEEYYHLADVTKNVFLINKLNRVQRKILSTYRFEIAKPKTIIFESPYWGMDIEEIGQFRRYLVHLMEKGIQIICFSKSLEELQNDCSSIIVSCNGKNVKKMK